MVTPNDGMIVHRRNMKSAGFGGVTWIPEVGEFYCRYPTRD